MDRRPADERAAHPVCPATAPGGVALVFARAGSSEGDAAAQVAAYGTSLCLVEVVEGVRH
jgi:hypothetical protein